jgi:transcriptional regulator with XRE-family HTH domain
MVLAKLVQQWYYPAMSDIGPYLKQLRTAKRMTLREAAEKAHLSNAYLSQIETGARGAPSAKHLRQLAIVYEAPVRELFEMAGYLDEPELHESEEDQVNRAFEFVMADTRFQAGTRVKTGLTTEAKRYIVEVYERVTGARLLDLR